MAEVRNIGASVRQRLLNLAKAHGQSFDLVLTRYALERLLYRLGNSAHADRFALKGALLLMTWLDEPHRATRDLDLLGFGDPSPELMLAIFREVLGQAADDGVRFDASALRVESIRDDLAYGGLRLRTTASIDGARVGVTVDIGFGDAIEPGLALLAYPSMLDQPSPHICGYVRETVIAEKFHAMVILGRANSRMKDFYDIWLLSRAFAFDDERLSRAIAATFARRRTPIPTQAPDALTPAFAADPQKQRQWRAFAGSVAHDPGQLSDVVEALRAFIMPRAVAAAEIAA